MMLVKFTSGGIYLLQKPAKKVLRYRSHSNLLKVDLNNKWHVPTVAL